MAILLSMEEEDYQALENGVKLPDDETLKRLCMMMEWNYYDVRRMVANEMGTPMARAPAPPAPGPAEMPGQPAGGPPPALDALQSLPSMGDGKVFDSLGERMKDVRVRTGQPVDIIAMLLNISPDAYRRMEAGEHPNDELLKKISIIYDWNYYDLISLLRSENARNLQPRQIGNPFPGASAHLPRLKTLFGEMESLFARIPERDQEMIISQLELVRETMRRTQQAS